MKRLFLLSLLYIGSFQAMHQAPVVALKEICAEGICKLLPSKIEGGHELFQICTGEVCKWVSMDQALKFVNDNPGLFQQYVGKPTGYIVKQAFQHPFYAASTLLVGGLAVFKYFPVLNFQGHQAHKKRMKLINAIGQENLDATVDALNDQHEQVMAELSRVEAKVGEQSDAVDRLSQQVSGNASQQQKDRDALAQSLEKQQNVAAENAQEQAQAQISRMAAFVTTLWSSSKAFYNTMTVDWKFQINSTKKNMNQTLSEAGQELNATLERHREESEQALKTLDASIKRIK